jgi:FlaA1/EpsC-like NDP-sugar epimerase
MRHILRSPRRTLLLLLDLTIFAACYYLAFLLRLERLDLGGYLGIFLRTVPLVMVLRVAGMYVSGVYWGLWNYASVRDLMNIIKGTAIGTVASVLGVVFTRGLWNFPRSVFLIDAILVIVVIGGERFAWRTLRDMQAARARRTGRPVIIVGAGDAAEDLIRESLQNSRLSLRPVGIVDDHPEKLHQEIHGVKVLGTVEDLPALAAQKGAEEILIAIPSATGEQMRRIVDRCRQAGIPYRTVPGAGDIIDGRVSLRNLREVLMEDLLRRPPVRLDRDAISAHLRGKKVLVTGAGGSIGSELCRQVARFGPERIIMLDHSENSLFHLDVEFRAHAAGPPYRLVVADVTDRERMTMVMRETMPDVVFHAAAHKHVPLMESNVQAAFRNNLAGTRVTAETAAAAGVRTFVMISTDKAVNPSSVMGLSKRTAEILVADMDERFGGTDFVSVRFGNVMGSEGSVIPLFRRQIETGGPVTVTHPEVMRYFMTIQEAVQLVLQAATMGRGGEIFILEMGEPLRIVDLARDMITLSGLEPDVDVPIVFTGLRPGEKLYEELMIASEGVMPTPHEKIMVLRGNDRESPIRSAELLERIESLAREAAPAAEILAAASSLVPEFRPADGEGAGADDPSPGTGTLQQEREENR